MADEKKSPVRPGTRPPAQPAKPPATPAAPGKAGGVRPAPMRPGMPGVAVPGRPGMPAGGAPPRPGAKAAVPVAAPAGARSRLPTPEPTTAEISLPEIDFDDLAKPVGPGGSPVRPSTGSGQAGGRSAVGEGAGSRMPTPAGPAAPRIPTQPGVGSARLPTPAGPAAARVPAPSGLGSRTLIGQPIAAAAGGRGAAPAAEVVRPSVPSAAGRGGVEAEIAFLDEEVRAVAPAETRRAALLHLEIARLLEASGAPAAKVEARVQQAAEVCPELGLAHRERRRFLRRRKAWDEALRAIDRELAGAAEPAARAALHLERGRILRDGLQRADAAEDFARALALVPGDPSATEALRTLFAANGAWGAAADALEKAAAAVSGERSLGLRREAALLCDSALGDPQRAAASWELVLAGSPTDPLALASLERLYAQAGRWLDLCNVLARFAGATSDPAAKFSAFLRAGTLAAERVGDAERASTWLEEAARVRPEDPAPLDALIEIRRRTGDDEGRQAVLARRAGLAATPEEQSALALRRAQVLAERLGRREEAIAVLRAALEQAPANAAVVQALLGLLGAEGSAAGGRRLAVGGEAWEGKAAERASLQILAAARIGEAAARAAALVRAGTACERSPEAAELARTAYERALGAEPRNRAAFDGLARWYEQAGAWKELAGLLERWVDVAADDAERRAHLRRLGALREERLGDRAGAVEAYERLRGLAAGDVTVVRELGRLYGLLGRWGERAARLREESELAASPEAKAELLWRAGLTAQEQAGDEAGAKAAYEAAVGAFAGHRGALEALARLAEMRGRWADSLRYADAALVGLPAEEQVERLLVTAATASERLGDDADALARCRRAQALAPRHAGVLEALARLFERRGEWKELAEVDAALAGVELDVSSAARTDAGQPGPGQAGRAATLRVRVGDLLAERLGAPMEAVASYKAALAAMPSHEPAFLGLERVLARTGDWAVVREVCRAAAEAAPDEAARVPWLRKLGALVAWRLGKPREAMDVLERILEAVPQDEATLRELFVLHVREKQWRDAADVLARLAAAAAGEPAVAAAYLKEEAALREAHLRVDAGERLAAALEAKPDDREAIRLCEEACLESVAPNVLLARRLAVAADPAERAGLRLRLAAAMEAAGDVTSLLGQVDLAAKEAPGFLPAVRAARAAAEVQEQWGRAVELLEQEGSAETTARVGARLDALRRAAELALERLGDPGRARSALAAAFELSPGDERVGAALGQRLREGGDWPALATMLRRHAAALEPTKRPPVLFELARTLRERLESPADAASVLDQLLAVAPRHGEALVMLGEIRAGQESWQQAIDAFRLAEAELGARGAEWRRVRLWRVDILTERLGLYGEAEQLLRDALGPDGADPEMLRRLAAVSRHAQNWAAVEDTVARLVAVEPPERAAEGWLELARLARGRRDAARVGECFLSAVRSSLDAPAAMGAVQAFALRELGGDEAVAILKDALYRLPPALQRRAGPLHLLVGRILAAQGRLVEAEGELRTAVELLPEEVDARLLLAQVSGDNDEVRASLLEAARRDPFRGEVYAGLLRLAERDERVGTLRVPAAQVLAAFGAADGGVEAVARQVLAPAGDKALRRDQLVRWVVHPAEPRVALELLAAAGPKLATLYPQPDYGGLEAVPRGAPIAQDLAAIAAAFGVEKYDAFFTRRPGVTATFVIDERPQVILAAGFGGADRVLARFYLGRVLALLAAGQALAVLLPPGEVKRLLDGVAGQHVEGLGDPAMVQRVGKALGWSVRRGLAGPCREYATPAPPDLSGWQAAATLTANRGGLIACGDFAAARAAVHGMAGIPAPHAGSPNAWDASRMVPALSDLLQFAVSPEYSAVRAHLI
ncbi:MAG: hypothetical protein HY907_15750 [Deltaproteobacteria bacterium]|nr:hypothetical protein [Deltaproteobacteria bacterium]